MTVRQRRRATQAYRVRICPDRSVPHRALRHDDWLVIRTDAATPVDLTRLRRPDALSRRDRRLEWALVGAVLALCLAAGALRWAA